MALIFFIIIILLIIFFIFYENTKIKNITTSNVELKNIVNNFIDNYKIIVNNLEKEIVNINLKIISLQNKDIANIATPILDKSQVALLTDIDLANKSLHTDIENVVNNYSNENKELILSQVNKLIEDNNNKLLFTISSIQDNKLVEVTDLKNKYNNISDQLLEYNKNNIINYTKLENDLKKYINENKLSEIDNLSNIIKDYINYNNTNLVSIQDIINIKITNNFDNIKKIQLEIDNIQLNLGDIKSLSKNYNNITSAINELQKQIDSYAGNNSIISNLDLQIKTLSNTIGMVYKLDNNYIDISDFLEKIDIIINNLISYNDIDLDDAITNLKSIRGQFNNQNSKVENMEKLQSASSQINNILTNASRINKKVINDINSNFLALNIMIKDMLYSYSVVDYIINLQNSVKRLYNLHNPVISDINFIKSNLLKLTNILGDGKLLNGVSITNSLNNLNEIVNNISNSVGQFSSKDYKNINENIVDLNFKVDKLVNQVSAIFSIKNDVTELQKKINIIQTSIGDYSDTVDINTSINNLRTSLNSNIQNTGIINDNIANIKTLIGNYVIDTNYPDIATVLSNTYSSTKQIQNVLGSLSYSSKYSNFGSAIDNINSKINNLEISMGGADLNNLKVYTDTLQSQYSQLRLQLGNLTSLFNNTNNENSTLTNIIQTMEANINNMNNLIGNYSLTNGDISTAMIKINKKIGNSLNNDKGLYQITDEINKSLSIIQNTIGSASISKSLSDDIVTLQANISNLGSKSNIITTDIINRLSKLENNLSQYLSSDTNIKEDLNNLKTNVGIYKSNYGNNTISDSINYIFKSVGNFISSPGMPDITTSINNLQLSLDSYTFNSNNINIKSAADDLSKNISISLLTLKTINLQISNNIIESLNNLSLSIDSYIPGKLNPIVYYNILDTNKKLSIFLESIDSIMKIGYKQYQSNLSFQNGIISSPELAVYNLLHAKLDNFNSAILSYTGGDNPTNWYNINELNSNNDNMFLSIKKIESSIQYIGNYVGNIDNPNISEAIKNIQNGIQYIGNYKPTLINPTISSALNSVQTAIGNYDNKTNLVASLDNLQSILGTYSGNGDNPDMSTAIRNIQSELSILTNYNIDSKLSNLLNSINLINNINKDFSSSIINMNNGIKYIGTYIGDTNNPDISTAIKNIQTEISSISSIALTQSINNIKNIKSSLIIIFNKSFDWSQNINSFAASFKNVLYTLDDNTMNNYNTNKLNYSFLTALSNVSLFIKNLELVKDVNSEHLIIDSMGIKNYVNQLKNEINIILGTDSDQTIGYSIINLQKSLLIANDNINNLQTSFNSLGDTAALSIINIKKSIPNITNELTNITNIYSNYTTCTSGLCMISNSLIVRFNLLNSKLNLYMQNGLNTDIINAITDIKLNLYSSFTGSSDNINFISYNRYLKEFLSYVDIFLGTASDPSIMLSLYNINKNIGIYTGTAGIASDLLNLSTSLSSINTNFNKLSTNIGDTSKLTGDLITNIISLQSQFDLLSTKSNTNYSDINIIKSTINNIQTDLSNNTLNIKSLQTGLKTLETTLSSPIYTTLNTKLTEMQAAILLTNNNLSNLTKLVGNFSATSANPDITGALLKLQSSTSTTTSLSSVNTKQINIKYPPYSVRQIYPGDIINFALTITNGVITNGYASDYPYEKFNLVDLDTANYCMKLYSTVSMINYKLPEIFINGSSFNYNSPEAILYYSLLYPKTMPSTFKQGSQLINIYEPSVSKYVALSGNALAYDMPGSELITIINALKAISIKNNNNQTISLSCMLTMSYSMLKVPAKTFPETSSSIYTNEIFNKSKSTTISLSAPLDISNTGIIMPNSAYYLDTVSIGKPTNSSNNQNPATSVFNMCKEQEYTCGIRTYYPNGSSGNINIMPVCCRFSP